MARLSSDVNLTGTIGNLVIYRVGSRTYVRTKSSLDRKRFQKDPAFARSREKAAQFGAAARLVKAFYQELPKEVKRHGLFGTLTAMAYKGLQENKSATAIVEALRQYCGLAPVGQPIALPASAIQRQTGSKKKTPQLSQWQVAITGRLIAVSSLSPKGGLRYPPRPGFATRLQL